MRREDYWTGEDQIEPEERRKREEFYNPLQPESRERRAEADLHRLQVGTEERRKAEAESHRIRAEAEERSKVETEAYRMRAEAEERRKVETESYRMRGEAEERKKREAENRLQSETEARRKAEAESYRIQTEAEERRKVETEYRLKAEAEEIRRKETEFRIQVETEERREEVESQRIPTSASERRMELKPQVESEERRKRENLQNQVNEGNKRRPENDDGKEKGWSQNTLQQQEMRRGRLEQGTNIQSPSHEEQSVIEELGLLRIEDETERRPNGSCSTEEDRRKGERTLNNSERKFAQPPSKGRERTSQAELSQSRSKEERQKGLPIQPRFVQEEEEEEEGGLEEEEDNNNVRKRVVCKNHKDNLEREGEHKSVEGVEEVICNRGLCKGHDNMDLYNMDRVGKALCRVLCSTDLDSTGRV
eukprot:TRINITY_DN586_c0_g3_i5.p1 TRINITY_DN586_c0_g3~~TRINITY_DN586_c0_g3_i5.p1  ORF type:complete len:421 (-),score=116.46 TRINITY_DN586_c0_g3_i5:405-1667(-)